MKLIISDEILRKYVPNVFATVAGEKSLFEKLYPWLEMAEEWVKDTFTSEQTFNTISGYTDANVIKTYTCKVVVAHALMCAVPSLDLVLTPNGFGIVSNSNVAPASKERVDRLIASLASDRDRAIHLLLGSLVGASKWLQSEQYAYFSSTMFPNIDLCDYIGIREHQWSKYEELRPLVLKIEKEIETHFIGAEQMAAFRKKVIQPSSSTSTLKTSVIRSLRAEIAQRVKARLAAPSLTAHLCSPPSTLVHIVDIIRNSETEFPEWHSSSIKELFNPPIFENKKKDTGYWF